MKSSRKFCALRAAPPAVSLEALASNLKIDPAVKLGQEDIPQFLSFVSDLSEILEDGEDVTPDTLTDVVSEMGQGDPRLAEEFPKLDWRQFRSRAIELFKDAGPAEIVSKIPSILALQERRLCPDNCRIASDIRPIFRRSTPGDVGAAIVVHSLRLAYHRGDEERVRSIYVGLTANDLNVLERLLRRALNKSRVLESLIQRAKVPLLTPDRPDGSHVH